MDHLRRGLARRPASSATAVPGAAVPPAPAPAPGAAPAPATTPPTPTSSLFPSHPSAEPAPGSPCRYLGLRDDPSTHFAYPSPLNRCHASGQPEPADGAYQAGRCLNESHRTCPRYAAARRVAEARAAPPRGGRRGSREAVGGETAAAVAASEADASTRSDGVAVATSPRPAGTTAGTAGTAIPRTSSTARQALRYLLLLAVMLVLGFALAVALLLLRPGSLGGFVADPSRTPASPAAQLPAASVTVPASAAPNPTAVATASASAPAGTAAPAPRPTSRPTAPPRSARPSTPAPPRRLVYYVQRGDTLISIAARFGITVDALRQANGLVGSLLQVGQQLIIPIG